MRVARWLYFAPFCNFVLNKSFGDRLSLRSTTCHKLQTKCSAATTSYSGAWCMMLEWHDENRSSSKKEWSFFFCQSFRCWWQCEVFVLTVCFQPRVRVQVAPSWSSLDLDFRWQGRVEMAFCKCLLVQKFVALLNTSPAITDLSVLHLQVCEN